MKKFEVYESNAGGLTLVVFGKKGLVEYIHSGYEYVPGSLKRDIQSLQDGDDPAVEWEGNEKDPKAAYDEIQEEIENSLIKGGEPTYFLVADDYGIYPENMGVSARKEFEEEE